jgi:hypothetical protein
MAELADVELDKRLSELERDLGPTLRAAYRGHPIRPGFTAQARAGVFTADSATKNRPWPALRVIHGRLWAALAAMLVGVLVVAGAVFANQPQPVSADILEKLEAEAYGAMVESEGPCPGPGAPQAAGGTLVVQSAGMGAGQGGPVTVTSTSANDLSERLAKELGVSGDRVRQAMLATVRTDMAAAPPEPMSAIAQQLGKTTAEVCAAFFDPHAAGDVGLVASVSSTKVSGGRPGPHTQAVFTIGGKAIDLNSTSASELSGPAQRLGVSPESMLAAVRAAVPSTPPPPPPGEDEIISRLANNLGMSQDKVRAAIKQVEGNGPFYFVVPLPALGR